MKFSYYRSEFKVPDKQVTSIIFDISRHGKYTHRIDFAEPIPADNAIYVVERFLSVPLDDEYYNRVRDDLWIDERHYFETRGDCLGDLKFLERLKEVEPSVVMIKCGS